MLPNFLIIGAPRAGTSWLAKNLRAHPQIFMPAEKELHFFDRHFDKGTGYYEAFFDAASGEPAIGEATPEYLYLPEVAQRIQHVLPHCRLILSLRNPVDRVYSRYWNAKAKFEANRALTFEEKLRQKPLFLDEGKYFSHLVRYYQYFPPERFLILLHEDIRTNPAGCLRRTYEFLGVDPSFEPAFMTERVNAAADKPFLARSRLLYYIHKAAGRAGLRSIARWLADNNAAELPAMSPETRRWLAEDVYGMENRKLEELTGIDVSRWT